MNYINRLEQENREYRERIAKAQEQIAEFRKHLISDKFYSPGPLYMYINIMDVEGRLLNINHVLNGGDW